MFNFVVNDIKKIYLFFFSSFKTIIGDSRHTNGYNPDVRSITVARSNSLRRASPPQQRRYVPDYPTLQENEQSHDRSFQGRPPNYERESDRYRGDPRGDPRDSRYPNEQRRDMRDSRDPRDFHRDPRDYRDHPDHRDGPHAYREGTLDRRSDDHNRSHNSSFDNRDMYQHKQPHYDGRGQYPYDHNQMPMNGNSMHHPDRSPRHHGETSPTGQPKNAAGLQYDRVSTHI